MILCSALEAMRSQFSTRHSNEGSIVAFDDFEIAHDKRIVKSDAAKSPKSIFRVFHQLNSHFGDLHELSPVAQQNGCVIKLTNCRTTIKSYFWHSTLQTTCGKPCGLEVRKDSKIAGSASSKLMPQRANLLERLTKSFYPTINTFDNLF